MSLNCAPCAERCANPAAASHFGHSSRSRRSNIRGGRSAGTCKAREPRTKAGLHTGNNSVATSRFACRLGEVPVP